MERQQSQIIEAVAIAQLFDENLAERAIDSETLEPEDELVIDNADTSSELSLEYSGGV